MTKTERAPIRVLIADDEADVRDAYRQILTQADMSGETAVFHNLRERLFARPPGDAARSIGSNTTFAAVFCEGAEAAVKAVRDAIAADSPFAVAFLDMRMPPGPDGVWAAARIRELDPAIEIVLCTAYSDVDPAHIGTLVPPEEKLSYLQKPFHPHEIRQMTISLASKWRAEHRIVKLAYFDPLTGLPNREQSRNRLASAVSLAKEHERMLAVLYLDLDNFKRVNDTFGHAVGGELLCMVAARMRHSLRADEGAAADAHPAPRTNHIARLGGDEFIVVLPGIRTPADAGDGGTPSHRRVATAPQAGGDHARGHPERRHLAVPDGRCRRRYSVAQRRSGDVLREAQGARHARFLRSVHERRRAASLHTGGAFARRARARRIHPALPAAVRCRDGHGVGHGGALALEQRASRRGAALGVHSDRGGDGTDPADRRVGVENPAGRRSCGATRACRSIAWP